MATSRFGKRDAHNEHQPVLQRSGRHKSPLTKALLTDNIALLGDLQEVKLQTSLYDASTGRSGGGETFN